MRVVVVLQKDGRKQLIIHRLNFVFISFFKTELYAVADPGGG
jgi:hypothetical protein